MKDFVEKYNYVTNKDKIIFQFYHTHQSLIKIIQQKKKKELI